MNKKLIAVFISLSVAVFAFFGQAGPLAVSSIPKQNIFVTMETQSGPTWGLDRVDGSLDGKYSYISSGKNVKIYVVDTGVNAGHPQLLGRVLPGYDSFSENLQGKDCNGHGTHVAGIVAGSYYGVAKEATIVPVRALDCSGRGTTDNIVKSVDWILKDYDGTPSIVNMSLGGPKDVDVNNAVQKLISAGIIVTVAAGNSNVDACTFSPASANGVISVGATDSSDKKASFSNWGDCVDIFAPGVGINSANSLNYLTSSKKSGTSQAAPFVAGAIATYISNGKVQKSADAESYLLSASELGVVLDGNSRYNNLVNVEKLGIIQEPPVTEPEPVVVEKPKPIVDTAPTVSAPAKSPSVEPVYKISQDIHIISVQPTSVKIAWNANQLARYYSVRVSLVGSSGYIYKSNTSNLEITVKNLLSNKDYVLTVVPVAKGDSQVTDGEVVTFSTPYGVPSSPNQITIKNDTLNWSSPSYNGGTYDLTYVIEKYSNGEWSQLATTKELYYSVERPDLGVTHMFRVSAKTPAGRGKATKSIYLVGNGIPNVVEPVPDLNPELSGSVSVSQRAAGSGLATVEWSAYAGADSYLIEKSPLGSENLWESVGITTKTSKTISLQPGKKWIIRVTARGANSDALLGTAQYEGLR
jgi:subtilisin family serine protease